MSQIPHKKGGHFSPLNSRKDDRTAVGQTYGDRRNKPTGPQESLFQQIKDRFFGQSTGKSKNIGDFASSNDRFVDSHQPSGKEALRKMGQLESGRTTPQSAPKTAQNPYTLFLDSVISQLDTKKKS